MNDSLSTLPDEQSICRWAVVTRLRPYAMQVARAVAWGHCDEGLAVSVLHDHAKFINGQGLFKLNSETTLDIARDILDRARHAICIVHEQTFNAMADAATEAYGNDNIRGAAEAAAEIARASARKPPPPYVSAAVEEAERRFARLRWQARKRRS